MSETAELMLPDEDAAAPKIWRISPHDDPDDTSYRGRMPLKSRVRTIQSTRDRTSPIRPRRSGRSKTTDARENRDSGRESDSREDAHSDDDQNREDRSASPESLPPVQETPPRKKSRSNRVKQVPPLAASDSASDAATPRTSSSTKRKRFVQKKPVSSPSVSPIPKKRRRDPPPPRTPSPASSDVELPSMLDILKTSTRKRRNRSPTKSHRKAIDYTIKFFDDEAVEDDGESVGSGDEHMRTDEYDYADSFIIAIRPPPCLARRSVPRKDIQMTLDLRPPPKKEKKSSRHTRESSSDIVEGTDHAASSERNVKKTQATLVPGTRRPTVSREGYPKEVLEISSDSESDDHRTTSKSATSKSNKSALTPTSSKPSKSSSKSTSSTPKTSKSRSTHEASRSTDATKSSKSAGTSTKSSKNTHSSPSKPSPSKLSKTDHTSPSKSSKSANASKAADTSSNSAKPSNNSTSKSAYKTTGVDTAKRSSDDVHKHPTPETPSRPRPKKSTSKPSNLPKPSPQPISKKGKGKAKDSTPSPSPRPETPDLEPVSKNKKGKGKAVSAPSPSPRPDTPDDAKSDDGLSPYEREQLEKAIAISKKANALPSKAGGSSSKANIAVESASNSKSGVFISMKDFVDMRLAELAEAGPNKTVVPPAPTTVSPNSEFREDATTFRRRTTLPDVDEVNDPSNIDPILVETYRGLSNLPAGIINSWSQQAGRGHPMFSVWGVWIPNMNGETAYRAITFTQEGHFRNPARTSPLEVVMRSTSPTNDRLNFYCATNPAVPFVGVSCGWVERSQIIASSGNGLRQRFISVILHSGEWERTVGFICAASGYPDLHGQLHRDALQFSSRAQGSLPQTSSPGQPPSTSGAAAPKRAIPANMFKRSTTASPRVATDTFSLPNDVDIPVYDAREVADLDFHKVLPRLAESLPPFAGEVPLGAFIVVGYTLTVYRAGSGLMNLGCNLLWAIVVGTPDT
ncbi:hypothetical protein DFP72DRAFT_841979 [Ephemerocybe angulata]|uniref:Uncharacterized protein n=1 Tax=Ephemerocybe angulata TaxID=980116 RepID=A0A8H6MAD6_9AGAR|nr:hypothetical protein DFP72DRAFT_841979 [Tulosesus angulatus]